MSAFKQFVRKFLEIIGIKAWPLATIPRGILIERDLQRIFDTKRGEGLTLFDVGANRGQTMEKFKKAFPDARVFCFEPIAETFLRLKRASDRFESVECVQMALGAERAQVTMKLHPGHSGWNKVVSAEAISPGQNIEEVEQETVDGFSGEAGVDAIDLLKTDCEGYDLNVLLGAQEMLMGKRIKAVLCEVTFMRNKRHGDFFEIESFLREYGFFLYGVYDYSSGVLNVSKYGFANALFVRANGE